jgi:TRAP-type C4-dicarboxylate transport system substrate-binding protein
VVLLLAAASAWGEPKTLRMASVAPSGSAWANEMKGFAREIEQRTGGRVRVKWYFNAVAGDEGEMAARVGRGQLDGMASGGMVCQTAAPSMRVLRIPGLFQTGEEANHVVHSLQAKLEAEARDRGWAFLGGAPLGTEVLLSKREVRSLAEMRSLRIWRWKEDDPSVRSGRAMGLTQVLSDLSEVNHLLDDNKVDALLAMATAALVFQWTTKTRYILRLPVSYLFGCILISSSSLADVAPEDYKEILSAAARRYTSIEEATLRTEKALFGGALSHQGVSLVEPSEQFSAEFFAAAKTARESEGAKLVPPELLRQVQQLLADFRAEHWRSPR